jgi:hypothetical protein
MGLVQSCIGLGNKNKVGVMSQEEKEAYKNTQRETELEVLESQMEPLNKTLDMGKESTDTKGVTELVEAKGGIAFNVPFHSTVPELPPISCTNFGSIQDHEKWKGMISLSLSLSLSLKNTEYLRGPIYFYFQRNRRNTCLKSKTGHRLEGMKHCK